MRSTSCWCGHSNQLLCAQQCTNQNSLAYRQWCSLCLLWNSLTSWISSSVGEDHFTLPFSHLHSPGLAHFHRCDDVIGVLVRTYSDITGATAKLNLLAPPCACGALQLEQCVHAFFSRAYWAKCFPRVSVIADWLISPLMPISAMVECHLFEYVTMTLQQNFRVMRWNENTAYFNR